jgi:hypothetical protein
MRNLDKHIYILIFKDLFGKTSVWTYNLQFISLYYD